MTDAFSGRERKAPPPKRRRVCLSVAVGVAGWRVPGACVCLRGFNSQCHSFFQLFFVSCFIVCLNATLQFSLCSPNQEAAREPDGRTGELEFASGGTWNVKIYFFNYFPFSTISEEDEVALDFSEFQICLNKICLYFDSAHELLGEAGRTCEKFLIFFVKQITMTFLKVELVCGCGRVWIKITGTNLGAVNCINFTRCIFRCS